MRRNTRRTPAHHTEPVGPIATLVTSPRPSWRQVPGWPNSGSSAPVLVSLDTHGWYVTAAPNRPHLTALAMKHSPVGVAVTANGCVPPCRRKRTAPPTPHPALERAVTRRSA